MMDINDVRKTLWNAYEKARELPEGLDGAKSSEAAVSLTFPNYWNCNTLEEFLKPTGICIYSYCLGPSRWHYFYKSDYEAKEDNNIWYTKDIYCKAVEEINQWLVECIKNKYK